MTTPAQKARRTAWLCSGCRRKRNIRETCTIGNLTPRKCHDCKTLCSVEEIALCWIEELD